MRLPGIDDNSQAIFDIPNLTGTPERNLLMAIMERAILDYVGNDRKEVEAASDWLFEQGDETPPGSFSFAWICQQLDLDRADISQKIFDMPKRGDRRIAPWYLSKGYMAKAS